jgi:hypothetical protein
MKYGHINYTRADTGKIIKVEWEGPPIIQLSVREFMCMEAVGTSVVIDKNNIRLGPYILKKVEEGIYGGDTYRRVNGPINIRIRSFLFSIKHWLSVINHRILSTLCIWKLVDARLGCVPSWSDLRIYKWVKRLFG